MTRVYQIGVYTRDRALLMSRSTVLVSARSHQLHLQCRLEFSPLPSDPLHFPSLLLLLYHYCVSSYQLYGLLKHRQSFESLMHRIASNRFHIQAEDTYDHSLLLEQFHAFKVRPEAAGITSYTISTRSSTLAFHYACIALSRIRKHLSRHNQDPNLKQHAHDKEPKHHVPILARRPL